MPEWARQERRRKLNRIQANAEVFNLATWLTNEIQPPKVGWRKE
jgi:hypothetical protein